MKCTNCGKENPEGTKFCGECGSRIIVPAAPQAPAAGETPKPVFCAKCGTPLKPQQRFCPNCGTKSETGDAASGVTAAAAAVSGVTTATLGAAAINSAVTEPAPQPAPAPAPAPAPEPAPQPEPAPAPAPQPSPAPQPEPAPQPAPAPQPEVPKFGFCPRCGTPLSGNTNFCPKCGTPAGGTAANNGGYTPNNNGYTPNNNGYTPNNGGYAPANVTVPTGGAASVAGRAAGGVATAIGTAAATTAVAAGKAASKKIWIAVICVVLALAAVASVLFFVILPGSKGVDERIIGEWFSYSHGVGFTFKSDGTGEYYRGGLVGTENFRFSAKDGKIEITYGKGYYGETDVGYYELNGEKLTIRWIDGDTYYFERNY